MAIQKDDKTKISANLLNHRHQRSILQTGFLAKAYYIKCYLHHVLKVMAIQEDDEKIISDNLLNLRRQRANS